MSSYFGQGVSFINPLRKSLTLDRVTRGFASMNVTWRGSLKPYLASVFANVFPPRTKCARKHNLLLPAYPLLHLALATEWVALRSTSKQQHWTSSGTMPEFGSTCNKSESITPCIHFVIYISNGKMYKGRCTDDHRVQAQT